jgi:hypothetical protein
MRYSVITADQTETIYEGTLRITDGGVAVLKPDDESPTLFLSPAFWHQIQQLDSGYDMSDSVH